jgi:glycosyltransferase involved in cell wall biosynthesis
MAALRARGHRLVLAARPDSGILPRAQQHGFPVFPLPFRHRFELASISGLRAVIRSEGVDAVNAHSAIDGWVAALATRAPGSGLGKVAVVRTRHLSIAVGRDPCTRWVYGCGCDAVVTTGEALRQRLIEHNRMDGRRIASVPTGVDLSRFDPSAADATSLRASLRPLCPDLADDEPLVGTVAMLRHMKGHHVLVEAMPGILQMHPKLRFVFIGDIPHGQSPIRDRILARAAELGVANRLILAGYRDDIPAVLAGLAAVVLPSIKDEGVPQGLTQALAMARPCVSTAVGAIGEVVRSDTGWLVPPGDAPALAAAVAAIFSQPGEARRRAGNGQALIRRAYSTEAMADGMERVFSRAIAARRNAATLDLGADGAA